MTEKEEAPLNEVNNIDLSENYARLSTNWTGLVTFACGPLSMGLCPRVPVNEINLHNKDR